MLIYFSECDLAEGFEILAKDKEDRLLRGRRVGRPSGWALYDAMRAAGETMQCWECGLVANAWIANKGRNDHLGSPVLDLYAIHKGRATLMTRDHIIPRSLGGSNDNANLRVGCSPCNGARGNRMDPIDIEFMEAHPELIVRPPNPVVAQGPVRTAEEKAAKKRADRKRRMKARREREKAARIGKNAPPKSGTLPHLTTMLALALA
jgi:5-methylcytosine-specific restriction endonuclease McrA